MLPTLLAALSFVALVAGLRAQQPTRPTSVGPVLEVRERAVAPAPQDQDASPDEDGDEEKEQPPVDSKRLKAFQQLAIDRRPSTVLKAWSEPEPEPADEDPELELPGDPPEAPKPPEAPGEDASEEEKKAHQEAMKAFQEEQQAHKKKVAEHKKKKAEIEQKRLQRELEILARHVTLGRWTELPPCLEAFGEEGKKKAYELLLAKLASPPQQTGNSQLEPFSEDNAFTFEDILGLVGIAPGGLEKEQIAKFAPLLNTAFGQGHGFRRWVEVLREEIARPEDERRLDRRQAALFLAALNRDTELGPFLPSIEEAVEADDREGLNLLARHHVANYRKEREPAVLEKAWRATIAALAAGEIEEEQKKEALFRAVELAPKVREELGDAWLEESFTERPERGMEVIATIGAEASKAMVGKSGAASQRLETLQLMKTAVDALLARAPERAEDWSGSLELLADVWRREAEHAYRYSEADSMGPVARRDSYGNIYWVNYGRNHRRTPVTPLEPGELLELRPQGTWRELLRDSVRPKFDTTIAELYLKVNEEELAFPYIEQLAATHPGKAEELAREFLEVWIRNHDPNASRNRTHIYNFAYGYNRRASGIPLTRSKQERNLRDLAEWVRKLRAVEGIELDTRLLVRAFTSCHSAAEVYRIETMEQVFGSLEQLEPEPLAEMAQQMRSNLATIWRVPAVQQQAGTRRKQKDIEAEVQRGYAVAQEVLRRALAVHPESWRLRVARAAMIHDLNNYRNAIQKSSQFAATRRMALELFAEAAETYTKTLPELLPDEESVEAFEYWFRAALGASDLGAIDESTRLAQDEIPRIREELESIPGDAGERHRAKFANALFTKLSGVNPAVKNRFLEAGFDIVGDQPQARAAREVYQYYKDLITEIELATYVDGNADVGTEPFGLRIDLRYTKNIERESGGFQKYLQNQANQVNRYYNYGRPQENYRDKFEEAARTALEEQFDVLSVTFNNEDVTSKADDDPGWRRMPYAYLLLRAKGPEVDRVPPLKIDLDFNEVTGYVVLPVTSPVVPLDASTEAEARPYEDLRVTQILDEREAQEGVLGLEIKAEATGLVPDLDHILDLAPSDFEVEDVEDQGVAVSRFGEDRESIRSERLWVVTMKAKEDVENPTSFRFAAPRDEEATEVTYQRYDDADLMTASLVVDLERSYGDAGGLRWWWFALPLALLVFLFTLWHTLRRRPAAADATAQRLPGRITPFTVLTLLQQLRTEPSLTDTQRTELDRVITRIESHYFGRAQDDPPDLDAVAREWLRGA